MSNGKAQNNLTPGTILGTQGEVVAKSADNEDPNMPPGVQALIETRINAALDGLRAQNSDDLQRIADQKSAMLKKLLGILGIIATASVLGNIYLMLFGEVQVKKWASEFFSTEILKPAFDEQLKAVAQKEASIFIEQKMTPLERKAEALTKAFEQAQKDISDKQLDLVREQHQLRTLLDLPHFAAASKTGDLEAFEKLKASAGAGGTSAALARTFLGDVTQYFESERFNNTQIVTIDPITRNTLKLTLEDALNRLRDSSAAAREGAANQLHDLEVKQSVESLVVALTQEGNLRVISRITRALHKITKQGFGPLDVEAVKTWWYAVTDKAPYQFPIVEINRCTAVLKSHNPTISHYSLEVDRSAAEKLVDQQKKLLSASEAAGRLRFIHILCLSALGRYEEADAAVANFIRPPTIEPAIARAYLNQSRGKSDEAAQGINKLLKEFPSAAEQVRLFKIFETLSSSNQISWPSDK